MINVKHNNGRALCFLTGLRPDVHPVIRQIEADRKRVKVAYKPEKISVDHGAGYVVIHAWLNQQRIAREHIESGQLQAAMEVYRRCRSMMKATSSIVDFIIVAPNPRTGGDLHRL